MVTVVHASTDRHFSRRALIKPDHEARCSRSFLATGRRLERIVQLGHRADTGFTPTTRALVRQAVPIYRFGWSSALSTTHPLPGESS